MISMEKATSLFGVTPLIPRHTVCVLVRSCLDDASCKFIDGGINFSFGFTKQLSNGHIGVI